MFLLIQRGRIDRVHFWSWYGQWWPLLLVGAGLVVLAEWAVDQHQMRDPSKPQYRRSFGGGVALLILVFIVTGVAAAHATHHPQMEWMFRGMHMDSDSLDEILATSMRATRRSTWRFPRAAR